MKKFINESWLVLVLGAVFAVLLAGAQTTLSDKIAENQTKAFNDAVRQVVPGVTTTEQVPVEGYDRNVYRCTDDAGQMVGWAIDAVGMGFADKIRMVIGLSTDTNTITGIKVIDSVETPGLGDKIRATGPDAFASQFENLKATAPVEVVKKARSIDKNEVQAITGATISSNAVTKIVNDTLERVRDKLPK